MRHIDRTLWETHTTAAYAATILLIMDFGVGCKFGTVPLLENKVWTLVQFQDIVDTSVSLSTKATEVLQPSTQKQRLRQDFSSDCKIFSLILVQAMLYKVLTNTKENIALAELAVKPIAESQQLSPLQSHSLQ